MLGYLLGTGETILGSSDFVSLNDHENDSDPEVGKDSADQKEEGAYW